MNAYTIHFKFAHEHVEATDTDMAVMKAAEIIAQDMTEEDRGELVAIELHGKNGMSNFFYTGADLTSDKVEEIVTRKEARPAPKKLPSRRQRGLCLSYSHGDLFVSRLGYSSSLSCAYHEEVLHHDRGYRDDVELGRADMKVIEEWMNHEADYYETNGWATWSEVNE